MINAKLLLNAIISGLVWWFAYLWIRRFYNPDNNGNVDKFKADAFYGAIASAASVVMKELIIKAIPM